MGAETALILNPGAVRNCRDRPLGPREPGLGFSSVSLSVGATRVADAALALTEASQAWASGAELPKAPVWAPGTSVHFADDVSGNPSRKQKAHSHLFQRVSFCAAPVDMAHQSPVCLGVTAYLSPFLLLSPAGRWADGPGTVGTFTGRAVMDRCLRGAPQSISTTHGSWADVGVAVLMEPRVSGSLSCHSL